MAIDRQTYNDIISKLGQVTLVAVSKTKPVEDILALYEMGQRDFGENYVQELVDKTTQLPSDIRWHFIGHLQSNKVKFIAPFVQLIHGVDSLKLLKEIGKHAVKQNRILDCLVQIHIASEETKFGMDENELAETMKLVVTGEIPGVRVRGLMGMASFTEDKQRVRNEFALLKRLYDQHLAEGFDILSMGMSGDYEIAIESGSTMVRIGSLLFGSRNSQ